MTIPIRTASVATLGCKLNQSESDEMARQLAEAGVALVPFGRRADLYLVNSCTVTHVSDGKSRQLIRQAVRANPDAVVVVSGCYVETDADAVAGIQGVDILLPNSEKSRLVEVLRDRGLVVGEGGDAAPPAHSPTLGGQKKDPLAVTSDGLGGTSRSRTRAFVKIQEGCDNHCSYCIVPYARGPRRSRPTVEVVRGVRRLVAEGCQEIVLTGVNITAYGHDSAGDTGTPAAHTPDLFGLMEKLLEETDVPRLRLSSLQPQDWSSRFYSLWGSGRLCRHLHLSLQSGSDAVLKRMRRRYNAAEYGRIVAEARQALPGVAITTDVIVGFPGETAEEFDETETFLRSIGLAGFHVFKYSPRSGTPAATMPGQLDPRIKQARSDRLIDLAEECRRRFCSRVIGSRLDVLWEQRLPARQLRGLGLEAGRSPWWTGLSDNYIRVYATSPEPLAGMITSAQVRRLAGEGVVAVVDA